jgi:membrane protein
VKVPAPIQTLVATIVGWRAVVAARAVLTRYDDAGGGLLAGGLTYSALFALLPSLLLLSGILGLLVDDPERRLAIIAGIGDSLPPLRGLVEASIESMADGAVGFGTIGLIGFAWGASRFYGSLDDAVARIFTDAPKRGLVARTIRGIVLVVLLVAAFIVGLVLTGIGSFLATETAGRLGGDTRTFWSIATPVLTIVVFVAVIALIYRVVPARPVPWGSLLVPAVAVGIVLALITQLFSYIAPRLIGSAAVYGTFIAIFAAMVWLSTGFQVLLIGAAWVRERVEGLGPASTEPVSTALAAPAAAAEASRRRQ